MPKLPSTIGPYTIQDELGRGGMAVVHRAVDRRKERAVALKVLPLEYAHNATLLKRFQREGINTQRLEHRNIVHVFEVGEAEGFHFIAMEIATNGTLSDRMRRQSGPLPEQEVITILQQVAAGLDYAHSQGYLHRDIKPSNILFADDGRAILGDFGVAKDLNEQDSAVTRAGGAVGTPAFMSPEQARGDTEISRRSDVYSLGVVAYYMITGRMPFEAENEFGLLRKIVDDPPPPPDRFNPRIHPGTAYILKLVLDKNPENRYSTAGIFTSQLAMNLSLPPRQRPVTPPPDKRMPTPHTPKTPIQQRTPTPNTPPSGAGQKTPSSGAKAATPPKEVLPAASDGTEIVSTVPARPLRRRGTTMLTSLVFLSATVGLVWTIWNTAPNGQEGVAIATVQVTAGGASSPTPTDGPTLTSPTSTGSAEGGAGAAAGADPTATATPTASPTNTPTHTPLPSVTPSQTPSVTPSATPSQTPTARATSTPSPTSLAAPPRPTSTPAKPTPTNTPTITPTPRWSPTAVPTVAAVAPPTRVPTRLPTTYDFALVHPPTEAFINYGRERFEWHTNYPLRSNQGLELVFWPEAFGPGGWMNGRSPVGVQSSGINETVWRHEISLTSFEDAQSEFFRSGEYYWGVLVVDTSPTYKRVELLNGAYRTFSYDR